MKKLPTVAAALFFTCFTLEASAEADMNTGNYWLDACSRNNLACAAITTGFLKGLATQAQLDKGREDICIPNGVTYQQISDVFQEYLKSHPESRHESVNVLLFYSLFNAFPCAGNRFSKK